MTPSKAIDPAVHCHDPYASVITVLLMLGVMAFYIRQMFRIGEVD
ncbi:hypothetical protein [Paractinoplanes globisporus]|uniref:Uncharacterized protein n=1 Tax=Paractinoplanes globisporus TaxID=113565 RepID=A0ABW6WI94_9ACTN|nr:hypothetical protein [Actinoplanes globisporus]